MYRFLKPVLIFCLPLAVVSFSSTQVAKVPVADPHAAATHAATLAESGRCQEALPLLAKSAAAHLTDKNLQKRVALDGARCAALTQHDDQLLGFIAMLSRQFPEDPEVLYVLIHSYSDLSTRAAQQLAITAPTSIPALELDAETNELQGKWDEAEKDYRKILAQDPKYPGIHSRLARILLSKPNPPADFQETAKKELQEELAIDPSNAGAEYILGELARQGGDLDAAIAHFTKASQLDPNFGDAFLGLGTSLLTEKKYAEAIPPLEVAVKLQPENPAGHYSLATAYTRTGRKEDAQKEFALHEKTSQKAAPGAQSPQ